MKMSDFQVLHKALLTNDFSSNPCLVAKFFEQQCSIEVTGVGPKMCYPKIPFFGINQDG